MRKTICPNTRRALAMYLVVAMFSILMIQPAASVEPQALNKDALTKLALQGTWQARSAYGHWSWSEDNSVCLRLLGLNEDCSDTGTWKIDEDVLCYELTWWGESYQMRKNCFTVVALDGGRYEALYHDSKLDYSVFINFEVLE
jgi:hypothetical protein